MKAKVFFAVAIASVLCSLPLFSQNLVATRLKNGLTVFIYEDPTQSDVFGEVVVKAGSVNDPAEYTGLAHYLEHLMFKGTTRIGALDWEAEKPVYEQIIAKYDEMADESDPSRKETIAKEINKLTIEEGKLSISQEYDNLIGSMGGSGMNAATSYDCTVYYNTFPANQISKWLTLASERFVNPVFRAFQPELETVYEEFNMYADRPDMRTRQFMLEKAFSGSPYARDVIGLGEHLKNPRLSKLIEFYGDWYVPSNMALIISGNVNARAVVGLINATFGHMAPGTAPQRAEYPAFDVKGRQKFSTNFANYPSTYLIYDGVPAGDPDEIPLTLCTMLLSNGSETGLLDQLTISGKLMAASASPMSFVGQGRTLLVAIPSYDQAQRVYASNGKVESYLTKAATALANGEFSQSTLNSIKTSLCLDYDLAMEDKENRANMLADIFVSGKNPSELMAYKDRVNAVTVDDIKRVAAKYFTSNYIIIHNELGKNYSNNKIEKPRYDPLDPPVGKSSEYAAWFKDAVIQPSDPSFLDWSEVVEKPVNSYSRIYYSKNDLNDVYTLTLMYGANSEVFPRLAVAASLMNDAGVMGNYTPQNLKTEFARLGSTYDIHADDEYLYVTMRGYESTLQQSCLLLSKLILLPGLDEEQINNLIGSLATGRMMRKDDVNTIGDALDQYIRYGDRSEYRTELTDKEIIDLSIGALTGDIVKAAGYAAEIHYTGSLPFGKVYDILSQNLPLVKGEKPSGSPLLKEMSEVGENTVYFVANSRARQAQIYFYVPMGDYDRDDDVALQAFNRYFSGGFSGLVMQEIREKNSMAYTAYGSVTSRGLPGSKTYFTGYIGTQNDKALGALDLFCKLLTDMPEYPENMSNIKTILHETMLVRSISPRSKSMVVSNWEKQGYSKDPAVDRQPKVEALTFDDVVRFYNEKLKGRPMAIGIVGNPKDISAKDLAKYGKVVKLSQSALFNDKDVLF